MRIIKKHKDIALKYNEQDGMIYFEFEETERKTKYIFEAENIIDEPVWENCKLEGFFIDGYVDNYIGFAKAERKDIKSGKPDWRYRGRYDIEYKRPTFLNPRKIYLKNKHNDVIYEEWKKQKDVYISELNKLNDISNSLI